MKRSFFKRTLGLIALFAIVAPFVAQASTDSDLCKSTATPALAANTNDAAKVVTTEDGTQYIIDGNTARKVETHK